MKCKQATTEKSSAVGDAAAMREALERVQNVLIGIRDYSADSEVSEAAKRVLEEYVIPALSAPRRNCDVGSAEEQWKRYRRFCVGTRCCDCPVSGAQCELAWAQMTYEADAETNALADGIRQELNYGRDRE